MRTKNSLAIPAIARGTGTFIYQLIHRRFLFILIATLIFSPSINAQAGLYFTHKKESNLRKLETTADFKCGDTIYGVLYVMAQNSNASFDDYVYTENGVEFVPVSVIAENGDQVSFSVELSSGINKTKKTGLLGAVNNAIGNQSLAFYFEAMPTSDKNLNASWIKLLANMYRSTNPVKKIRVRIGGGQAFRTVVNDFTLDMRGGTEPYSTWAEPYIAQETKIKEDKRAKFVKDSLDEIKAKFDKTESSFPPELTKSKIVDARLEKEITNYYKSMGYEVYKICIWDAESSSTFLVFAVVKYKENCSIIAEWLERQNPYGDLVKFKNAQLRGQANYTRYPLRCEKAAEYTKY